MEGDTYLSCCAPDRIQDEEERNMGGVWFLGRSKARIYCFSSRTLDGVRH